MKHLFASCLILGISSATLSSCGFQPVYGNTDALSGPIAINQIDGRIGHRLRQELARTLRSGLPGVSEGAFLTVTASESIQRLNLQANDSVSRTTIVAAANYTLRDADGQTLLFGNVKTQTDYDVAVSEYGDIALQTDARERVALLLARRLQEQLTLDASSARQTAQMKKAEELNQDIPLEKTIEEELDELDRIR